MKIYLLDDDDTVLVMLKMILKQKNLGIVCGSATDARDALEDLRELRPDLIIVDLLMPHMDGIKFVKLAHKILPETKYIMLSQVSSKDMIALAYEAGVEFFIQKPINAIEVESVIRRVTGAAKENTETSPVQSADRQEPLDVKKEAAHTAMLVLQQLGVSGDKGCTDALRIIKCMVDEEFFLGDISLIETCGRFSDTPKSMEQRIRRCLANALNNLAQIGIEDYANDIFVNFAGLLFNYEQVRREMNYVLGRTDRRGTVKAKRFLNALTLYSITAAEKEAER